MSAVLDKVGAAAGNGNGNGAAAPQACFHCGLPVPPNSRWHAAIDDVEQRMCCPGCAAAAQAIADGGCADYYANRTEFALPLDDGLQDAPELALYDHMGMDGEGSFTVERIRCAACVWLIERQLHRIPGVLEASLNVATERLFVRWDAAVCRPSTMLRTLRAIGYPPIPTMRAATASSSNARAKSCFASCSWPAWR